MAILKDLTVLGPSRFVDDARFSNVMANLLTKIGGTSSLFLKADGSVDSNTYYQKPNSGIPRTDLASDVLETIFVDLTFDSINSSWTSTNNYTFKYTSTQTLSELVQKADDGKNIVFRVNLIDIGTLSNDWVAPGDRYYLAPMTQFFYDTSEDLYYLIGSFNGDNTLELIDSTFTFIIRPVTNTSNNSTWQIYFYDKDKLKMITDAIDDEAKQFNSEYITGDMPVGCIVDGMIGTYSNNYLTGVTDLVLKIEDIAINYATLDSPTLTGTPTAPTATTSTNTTLLATTAFVLLEIGSTTYAGSASVAGPSNKSLSVPIATVDSTSTSKAFTVQVPEFAGETELRDGLFFYLFNNVVAAASGYTLNVNGLGAKPVWTVSNARSTTGLSLNKMFPIWYNSSLDDGNGAWVYGLLSDTTTNSLGYVIRCNNGTLPMSDRMFRYRIYFTSADGSLWVPSTTSNSTNATTARSVNQRPINPFGPICVYYTNSSIALGSSGPVTAGYQLLAVTLGYAFNPAGGTLELTVNAPVYVKCSPQADGSAIIDATTPYTQSLPTTEDGYIYIFLGIAYSAILIELRIEHPVYYYKDGAIRLWTALESRIASLESRIAALELIIQGS